MRLIDFCLVKVFKWIYFTNKIWLLIDWFIDSTYITLLIEWLISHSNQAQSPSDKLIN